MIEDDAPFAIGQRNESDPDPVIVGDRLIEIGSGRQLVDAAVVVLGHRSRRSVVDTIGPRALAHRVAHVGQRQRQNLAAQRLVERRQAVELQQTDHRAQRQPVDQQREQHEACRQHGNQLFDRGVDGGMFGQRQGQSQRDRAAQAAPGNRKLIGAVHLLAESQSAQYRHDAEQHGGARQQRRRHHDQQQPGMPKLDRPEQPGHQCGGHDEDQRACPEIELRPDALDVPPISWPDADPGDRPGRQPGARDRDDAGHVQRVLADDVDDVGQRQRQRHLGGARTAEPGQRGAEQLPRDRAKREAADECRSRNRARHPRCSTARRPPASR